MDEKRILPAGHRPKGLAGRALVVLSLIFIVYSFTIMSGTAPPWRSHGAPGHHCGHHSSRPGIRYRGEHLTWQPCGDIEEHNVECSNITVPMDQFASEPSDKTFNIALIRMRGHNATQGRNLLLNPGGPGGSGLEFMYRKGKQLNAIVGEGYHLVSFDPRGVNQSTPLALCYPDSQTRAIHGSVRSKDAVADSGETFAWADNFVRACADTMGEHGNYMNTPQTAADMNNILDALGQPQMHYWGFSYGTILGQTYAAMFPERSERVIIDGVANVFDWYDGLLDTEMFDSTDDVLGGFFQKCSEAGDDCALSYLGDTAEDVKAKVLGFLAGLKEQPLNVYVNSSIYGLVDHEMVYFEAIFSALYKPENWYRAAKGVASVMKGNATEMFMAFGVGGAFSLDGEANEVIHLNDALSGPEYWPKDRQGLVDMIVPSLNISSFAMTSNSFYYQRQKWNLPKTHSFRPGKSIETAHPLLILSTTYDPVCPLKSAKVARAAFKDSRLVEVLGYGHCSVAVPSTCLAQRVREFLYEGKLPDSDTTCEAEGKYFAPPEEQQVLSASKFGDDEEKRKIHQAQMELAQETDWPARW